MDTKLILNTDASILVYKFSPERTGFNMCAEYTQLQLTFFASEPWYPVYFQRFKIKNRTKTTFFHSFLVFTVLCFVQFMELNTKIYT